MQVGRTMTSGSALRVRYSRDELLASHDYARPDTAAGERFHGGFDADGRYRPPRTRFRRPAVAAWTRQLKAEGHDLIPLPREIYALPQFPTVDQQAYLIRNGLSRPFYDAMTTTADVERRAGAMRSMEGPDFATLVSDPGTDRAFGHLNLGLLSAHGLDEGGDPDHPDRGAHDRMWLVARDLLMDRAEIDAQPSMQKDTDVAAGLFETLLPEIPRHIELTLRFYMNVLLSEYRADLFFDFCDRLLRRDDVFVAIPGRREEARRLIARIARDEISHVGYLRVALSELRAATWTTVEGDAIGGAAVIDPLWREMTRRSFEAEHQAAEARRSAYERLVEEEQVAGRSVRLGTFRSLGAAA